MGEVETWVGAQLSSARGERQMQLYAHIITGRKIPGGKKRGSGGGGEEGCFAGTEIRRE